jgi:hypothetical protein
VTRVLRKGLTDKALPYGSAFFCESRAPCVLHRVLLLFL